MGERDRDTAGHQNNGVDERQTPRRHRFRGCAAGGHEERPSVGEIGPQQQVGFELVSRTGQPRHRDDSGVEERAEESGEEHDLRDDEPEHSHAIGAVELTADHTLERIPDDGPEPAEHHKGDHRQPNVEDRCAVATRGRRYLLGALLNEVGRSKHRDK